MIDTNKMEIQSVIKGIVTKEMNNGRTLDTAIKVSFLIPTKKHQRGDPYKMSHINVVQSSSNFAQLKEIRK